MYSSLVPHLGRADGLAQLAGDAALLAAGVAPQGVLSAEAWAERPLLERVVDRHLRLEEHLLLLLWLLLMMLMMLSCERHTMSDGGGGHHV